MEENIVDKLKIEIDVDTSKAVSKLNSIIKELQELVRILEKEE